VKRSALVGAEVPPGVDTVTFSVAAGSAGDVAVIWVADTTTTPVAAIAPKFTDAAAANPVPVIVTDVPPEVGPPPGARPVTTGTGRKVNVDEPPPEMTPSVVVTVTLTVPAASAGDVAVIWDAESTV
jgi:hypothetical protein